jgi:hypothetical protein
MMSVTCYNMTGPKSAAMEDRWIELHEDLREDVLRRVYVRSQGNQAFLDTLRAIAWTSKANCALVKALSRHKLCMLVQDDDRVYRYYERPVLPTMIPELRSWRARQTITHVSFAGVRFRESDSTKMYLRDIPNLRRLDVKDCEFHSRTALTHLLMPVAGMLTHLDLDKSICGVQQRKLSLSHKVVALMQRMEYLDVYDQLIDDKFVHALLEGPATTLKTLRIQCIAEDQCITLVTALSRLENLRVSSIYLPGPRFRRSYSDKYVLYPFLRLSQLTTLRALNLTSCSMIRAQDLKDLTALTHLATSIRKQNPSMAEIVHWDPRIDETYPMPPLRSLDMTIGSYIDGNKKKPWHASIHAFLARAAPGLSSCKFSCYSSEPFHQFSGILNVPKFELCTGYGMILSEQDVRSMACFPRLTRLKFRAPSASASEVLTAVGMTCTRLVELNLEYSKIAFTPPAASFQSSVEVWSRLEVFTYKFDGYFIINSNNRQPDSICAPLIPWLRCMTRLKRVDLDLGSEVMMKFENVSDLFHALPSELDRLSVHVVITSTERAEEFAALILAKFKTLRELTVKGKIPKAHAESMERALRAGMPFLIVQNAQVNVY